MRRRLAPYAGLGLCSSHQSEPGDSSDDDDDDDDDDGGISMLMAEGMLLNLKYWPPKHLAEWDLSESWTAPTITIYYMDHPMNADECRMSPALNDAAY